MYSYEDRIKAMRLYIKLGKGQRATVRQLGYPTLLDALVSGIPKKARLALRAGYTRSMWTYDTEQKRFTVQCYFDHDRCIAFTVKALGYPCRASLTAWIDELHPRERPANRDELDSLLQPPSITLKFRLFESDAV